MQTNALIGVMAALFLGGCAATTPAPRFSAVSPADKDGPEAGTPPPAPALASEPEAQPLLPPVDAPKPAAGHEGHSVPAEAPAVREHEGHSPGVPAAPSPADQWYTCPMHPEVRQASPGSCPKCGMTLVRRSAAKGQP